MLPPSTHLEALIASAIDSSLEHLAKRAKKYGAYAEQVVQAAIFGVQGGKRFRPKLVLDTYQGFQLEPQRLEASQRAGDFTPSDELLKVAVSFELLHSSFVVHDDLIDRDFERRGKLNIAGTYRQKALAAGASRESAIQLGDAAGVLAGDLLLYEAIRLISTLEVAEAEKMRLLELLDEAIIVSAAGELADIENQIINRDLSAESVLAATCNKTAVYSFSCPMQAGAILAGANEDQLKTLAIGATNLGIAFQLVDDLIGAFGSRTQAGREPATDLLAQKETALITTARQHKEWQKIKSALESTNTGPLAVQASQQLLIESGVKEEVENLVRSHLLAAKESFQAAALPGAITELYDNLAAGIQRRMP